ncbi:beta-ketoacyl synthase N-terminal-like domain-containing protein [Streptomyces sp. NPDC018029]|uniref:beta-ketoacyl synthase N-terminal-like domain-containing protein n=1 Tax=Streptomyces sp. NPDC018029 TaxID=3365032 RepID=UPI00379515D0
MTEPAPWDRDSGPHPGQDSDPSGDLDSAVAIVGMSGRFPGAPDLATYWANLRDGVCSIVDFTEEELLADGADPAELRDPNHVPAKGHLAGADRFDAELFGFNRTEAAALDPQHRLLLETAWAALEDAGHDPLATPARTGVYVGGSPTEHMLAAHTDRRLAASIGAMQIRILTDREFLAPWISYRLGLEGPSLTVQTACSTSLTAVHLAAQALLLGECDTALAGGVSVDTVRRQGYVHYAGGIFSPDGRCRPFDERAGGTVPGSGVGVVVLRRLSDALADGDPIRAVVRGTALTNDGATKVGFTAPGVEQQTAAVVEAWSAAGLRPSAAQYVETHGTATELGDRIELAAATEAFTTKEPEPEPELEPEPEPETRTGTGTGIGTRIGIGSVKSNIGHLDAAAGVASLIKVVLMLEHATLAPTVNVTRPHPELRLDATPFHVVDRAAPWPRPAEGPRRAGVSSLGIGGTNVHVVVEQAPERPTPPDTTTPPGPRPRTELLPLSARTEPALTALARALATALRAPDAPSLADVAHTLRTGRTPMDVRAYVLASDPAEAAERLTALAEGRPADDTEEEPDTDGLRELGEVWLKGGTVLWPEEIGGGRRVSLPTYPFAGESHGALTLPRPTAHTPTDQTPTEATKAMETREPPEAPAPEVPATEVPATGAISELLAEALGLEPPVSPEMTYFAAGGDSLTAVHLVGRLRDDFGIEVPITLFLEELTLQELADRIAASKERDEAEDSLDALLAEFEAE